MSKFNLTYKYRQLVSSKLLSVFLGSGLATGVKMISAVVLSKVIAIKLGAAGLAMIGQLTSFVSIALLLSTGGMANGIIKYIAELSSETERKEFIYQSFKLLLIIAAITGLLTIAGSYLFSLLCFGTPAYAYVFILLGISLVMYAVHTYLTSLLNGLSAFKKLNWINGIASLLGLAMSVPLIWYGGLDGALSAVAINQTIACGISMLLCRRYLPEWKPLRSASIQKKWVSKLFSYSLMAFTTAILTPALQIIIRNRIIRQEGMVSAGYWEAINRLSLLYLTIFLNVMLIYYLPKISSEQNRLLIKREIRKGFLFFLPLVFLMAAGIYMLRQPIVEWLLSPEFKEILPYFAPQLVGDCFKILSYIFAYVIIAKAHTRFYIASEVGINLFYIGSCLLLLSAYGVLGTVYAYCITYMLYFIIQFVYNKMYI